MLHDIRETFTSILCYTLLTFNATKEKKLNLIRKGIRHVIQTGLLTVALLFTANTQASWYAPFGIPSSYSYKECHIVMWTIGTHGLIGDITADVEICAYYDEGGEVIGWSMTIV